MTIEGQPNYDEQLDAYMAEHGWSEDRQVEMRHYVRHGSASSEAVLGILAIELSAVREVDGAMANQGTLDLGYEG